MLRIPKQWLALIALSVLALVLIEKSPTVSILPTTASSLPFPSAFMTDIETLEYDPEGKLQYRLQTPLAEYFQATPGVAGAEDYTLITQPEIVFLSRGDTAPWRVNAERGRSDAQGRLLRLMEGVMAEQQTDTRGLLQVTTSELTIDTQGQYAETDKAVKMRAQQGEMETVGMRAFLAEDRIELLSQVRGVYAP